MSRKLTRKEKEALGMPKPPQSKFEAKRAAERAALAREREGNSPFAGLRPYQREAVDFIKSHPPTALFSARAGKS